MFTQRADQKDIIRNHFVSTHMLDFEIAPWGIGGFDKFRVGTCRGAFRAKDKEYQILAFDNEKKHNGHFGDVPEWFEFACRRDGYSLRIQECWNQGLKWHLMTKKGFVPDGKDDVIKHFK